MSGLHTTSCVPRRSVVTRGTPLAAAGSAADRPRVVSAPAKNTRAALSVYCSFRIASDPLILGGNWLHGRSWAGTKPAPIVRRPLLCPPFSSMAVADCGRKYGESQHRAAKCRFSDGSDMRHRIPDPRYQFLAVHALPDTAGNHPGFVDQWCQAEPDLLGFRVSEVIALQWDLVDLGQGRLHVNRLQEGIASVHPLRLRGKGPGVRGLGISPWLR